jgi:hypothetical protein
MTKSGFNEKAFTFLMEDTYLRVKDYLKLFNQNTEMVKILNNTKQKQTYMDAFIKLPTSSKLLIKWIIMTPMSKYT